MGDRGNVRIIYPDDGEVWLYTHWSRYTLKADVAKALDRGSGRWDDESYLARIIFSEMIREDIDGETGYGISPYQTDGDETVVIDFKARPTVLINGLPPVEYIDKHLPGKGKR